MQKVKSSWEQFFDGKKHSNNWWKRKKQLIERREAKIVQTSGKGQVYHLCISDRSFTYEYLLRLTFLIREFNQNIYAEEHIVPFCVKQMGQKMTDHQANDMVDIYPGEQINRQTKLFLPMTFPYDRLAAIRHAERWWNSVHPLFTKYINNDANFVYQCLLSGFKQLPTSETSKGSTGLNQYKRIHLTAYDLRWSLSQATGKVSEVSMVEKLRFGDIICYDFEGENKWEHIAIVTGKDGQSMPLVHAQSFASRYRYWSYEDSLLWTEQTRYKFYRIK